MSEGGLGCEKEKPQTTKEKKKKQQQQQQRSKQKKQKRAKKKNRKRRRKKQRKRKRKKKRTANEDKEAGDAQKGTFESEGMAEAESLQPPLVLMEPSTEAMPGQGCAEVCLFKNQVEPSREEINIITLLHQHFPFFFLVRAKGG